MPWFFSERGYDEDLPSGYGSERYVKRSQELAKITYGARKITREDHEGRTEIVRDNLCFYGAPHVAFLFMPEMEGTEREAADLGMYAQNFLLSLAAHSYHGIPQAAVSLFAGTTRKALGVEPGYKLLFGIAFGCGNEEDALFNARPGRVELAESIVLHGYPRRPLDVL
ncbi:MULTISPECIES: nitroreductase family protein [unclassified Rothia (in: high G+C Gram-positive bacteria)]|uniref:nitroreductase family protein n=1 Tax=unclassified Rothia (in: high G+C Gram-positive bacteria) TaxID=2689056 RepID=UPI00195A5653|nr:nitroreductase family protein [Rothia sp. ZJ932]MBM7050591.1 nitroreductase family protein [Rothia sp. ZJ1223]QRZ60786.1 nitroreductase family protein [Rothia sp. ZJ932]